MAAKICPKCKSLMIDGRCTNKQCMSTVLDIDHYSLECELKKQFKNIHNIHNLYANPHYASQKELCDTNSVFDKYGFRLINKQWFIFAHEKGIPIDSAILLNDESFSDGYLIETMKEVTPSQTRKYAKFFRKYMILHTCRFGKGKTFNFIWASNDGIKWENASKICGRGYEVDKLTGLPSIFVDIASTVYKKYMSWAVSIKSIEDGVEVVYFIHKDRAYEIFKNREIKEGKKRRTALRHYVGEYTKEDGRLIEAYLRCDPKFEWNGMQCEIIPPISIQQHIKELRV